MIEFLIENWKLILEIVVLFASIIFFIVRKKPVKVTDSLKTIVVEYLPSVINRVEDFSSSFERKLSGEEKLQMALSIVIDYLLNICCIDEREVRSYRSWIINRIEDILSTPQKKGD